MPTSPRGQLAVPRKIPALTADLRLGIDPAAVVRVAPGFLVLPCRLTLLSHRLTGAPGLGAASALTAGRSPGARRGIENAGVLRGVVHGGTGQRVKNRRGA